MQGGLTDKSYDRWKAGLGLKYDYFDYHKLESAPLSCRWSSATEFHRFYLGKHREANSFMMVMKYKFDDSRLASASFKIDVNEDAPSRFVNVDKIIIHPGRVNKIREVSCKSSMVATCASKCSEVYIWNLESQRNHRAGGNRYSRSTPDLVLSGLKNEAFALAMCETRPFVLSGGKDKSVAFWSLDDGGLHRSIRPRKSYESHSGSVQDIAFKPSSEWEFCSVGDDSFLIQWDTRTRDSEVTKTAVRKPRCLDWNFHEEHYIITGSEDYTVSIFDRRNLSSHVHIVEGHTSSVLRVQWSPGKKSVFGTLAQDGMLTIWDFDQIDRQKESWEQDNWAKPSNAHAGLILRHAGQRGNVVDFHWIPSNVWTIASVSIDDNCLQIWRLADCFYKEKADSLRNIIDPQMHWGEQMRLGINALPLVFQRRFAVDFFGLFTNEAVKDDEKAEAFLFKSHPSAVKHYFKRNGFIPQDHWIGEEKMVMIEHWWMVVNPRKGKLDFIECDQGDGWKYDPGRAHYRNGRGYVYREYNFDSKFSWYLEMIGFPEVFHPEKIALAHLYCKLDTRPFYKSSWGFGGASCGAN